MRGLLSVQAVMNPDNDDVFYNSISNDSFILPQAII